MAIGVIRELDKSVMQLKKEVQEIDKRDKEKLAELQKKYSALKEVLEYVDSYEWLKHNDAKEKMRVLRCSNYDYSTVAEQYGVTTGAMRVFMNYASKRLQEKIGASTVKLIMSGDIDIAMMQFQILRGDMTVESNICKDALSLLPEADFKPFDLSDCKNELQFFYNYSVEVMKKRLSKMDKDKLAFIMYVLEKDSPKYAEEKCALMSLLLDNNEYANFNEYFESVQLRSKQSM